MPADESLESPAADGNTLVVVHTRLFKSDVEHLKKIAEAAGSKWQIELRQLIRRALKGERREVVMLSEERTAPK